MSENLQFVIFKGKWTYRLNIESTSQGFLWLGGLGELSQLSPSPSRPCPQKKFPENDKEKIAYC